MQATNHMDEQFPPLGGSLPPKNLSWAQTLTTSSCNHGGVALRYIAPTVENDKALARLNDEDVAAGLQKWKHAAVGFVLGANLPYSVIKRFVDMRWKSLGSIDVFTLKSGSYVFNFATDEDKTKAIDQSPWPLGSKMLFLKPWNSDLNLGKEDVETVPIWARLPNLKLHHYTPESLSKIASTVGIPLYTDKQTSTQERLSYARVCIEINTKSELPKHFPYVNEKGALEIQEIIYEWLPPMCKFCNVFGHNTKTCSKSPKTVPQWKPKIPEINIPEANPSKTEEKGKEKMIELVQDLFQLPKNTAMSSATNEGTEEQTLNTSNPEEQATVIEESCVNETSVIKDSDDGEIEAAGKITREGIITSNFFQSLMEEEDYSGVANKWTKDTGGYSRKQGRGAKKKHQKRENKVRGKNIDRVFRKCFNHFGLLHNARNEGVGRVWICWNTRTVQCTQISTHKQAITSMITYGSSSDNILVTVVYGSNTVEERRDLWVYLLQTRGISRTTPWIILGDFNIIRQCNEKIGSSDYDLNAMDEFNNCVNALDMEDCPGKGYFFTWCNLRDMQARIYTRIDRVLANIEWINKFPQMDLEFEDPSISDHSPIVIRLRENINTGPKPFKYQSFWNMHPDFKHTVASVWEKNQGRDPVEKLQVRLKMLKESLKVLNRKHYRAISDRTSQKRDQLVGVQQQLRLTPFDELLKPQEEALKNEYADLLLAEEKFYQAKSRVRWLKLGDKNTKFFHRKILNHQARNRLMSIYDEAGNHIIDYEELKSEVVSFYKDLFSEKEPFTDGKFRRLQGVINKKLSAEMNRNLQAEISEEEIKTAFFTLKKESAPGPDGYTAAFYIDNWEIVGRDVMQSLKYCLDREYMYWPWNNTALTLIPKVDNAAKLKDFRPIACSNVIYKGLSKVLTLRLKKSLPDIIGDHQTAFLQGRSIADNIMLMHDIVRSYNRRGGQARSAVKVDIMKAFDTVNWEFLFASMGLMNFPHKFINWIRMCVSTPSFSINLNGSLTGHFKSERGLRQGDPLSPYLFLIAMEVFSMTLESNIDSLGYNFHPKCRDLKISHLCFADDLFLISGADENTFRTIKKSLDEFAWMSGLKPNLEKSTGFYSGISEDEILRLCRILGIPKGTLPVKYLGLPLITSKLSYLDCAPIITKMQQKIQGWANKKLSYGGRLQCVISVLSSIQVYWSSIFILPKKVVRKLDSILASFLWSGEEKKHYGAKVQWKDVCKPKEEGGLGVQNLAIWNKGLILKHIWNIATKKDTLWIKWLHAVKIKGKSLWSLKIPADCSWIWRKILQLRSTARHLIKTEVGDGSNTFLWWDNWHNSGPIIPAYNDSIIRQFGSHSNAKLSTVLVNGQWNWPNSRRLNPNVYNFMVNLPCHLPTRRDQSIWLPCRTGFTVESATKSLRSQGPKVPWSCLIWYKNNIPRAAFIEWLLCRRKLNTRDRLIKWRTTTDPQCPLCLNFDESMDHLFFQCQVSAVVWKNSLRKCLIERNPLPWSDEIVWMTQNHHGSSFQNLVTKHSMAITIYHLWKARNDTIFKGSNISIPRITNAINEDMIFSCASWKKIRKNKVNWHIVMEWGLKQSILANEIVIV